MRVVFQTDIELRFIALDQGALENQRLVLGFSVNDLNKVFGAGTLT